jgi:hypothetical protein
MMKVIESRDEKKIKKLNKPEKNNLKNRIVNKN